MSASFMGEIRMFAGSFAPSNWAYCNGQLEAISQNTALFAIIGTTYGGDGVTTFGLPNLQGRAPLHWGSGAGLTPRSLGEQGGTPSVTLLAAQMPQHSHAMMADSAGGNQGSPSGNTWGRFGARTPTPLLYNTAAPNAPMRADALGTSGGNQPHNNMSPYLAVTFIIALFGVFPSRN